MIPEAILTLVFIVLCVVAAWQGRADHRQADVTPPTPEPVKKSAADLVAELAGLGDPRYQDDHRV